MARPVRLEFTGEAEEVLGPGLPVVRQGMRDYLDVYGSIGHSRIVVDARDEVGRTRHLPGGGKENTVAVATPGRITLVPDVVRATVRKGNPQAVRNLALHEMTHASKPVQPMLMDVPISLPPPDPALAYGIHGLSLLVRLPNGEQSMWGLLEEGACEALASQLEAGYFVQDEGYNRLGRLTLELMKMRGMPPTEVGDRQQANDLWGFVNRIFRRPKASRRPQDLLAVFKAYRDASAAPGIKVDPGREWMARVIRALEQSKSSL